jgi:hypothetical protein
MTPQQAVGILNSARHHGHSGWSLHGFLVFGESPYEVFEPFEAVAIARLYLSDRLPPARPVVLSVRQVDVVRFTYFGREFVMLTYSVQASDAAPDVTKRTLSVTINGGTPATGPLDANFTCNNGENVVLTLVDTNAAGVDSDPSDPYTFTANDTMGGGGGGGAKPNKPTILGVTQLSSTP